MPSGVAIGGDAVDVLLGEAQAVRSMVRDDERRGRLADLIAAISEGEVPAESADDLSELLELALETGRIRALYGPGGEQAALRVFRSLPRGKELAATAREVSSALSALVGGHLDKLEIQAPAPGAFLVTVAVEGRELAVRLDGNGARIASVAT